MAETPQISGSLKRAVKDKVCVVTGSSDGIGARLALRLAMAGANVMLVARSAQKLQEVGDGIRAAGGEAHEYTANLSVEKECDKVLDDILADHGRIDIFVSNAGRSIRRSVKYQGTDRFHDFQRLMALNYFGALRLITNVLPVMAEQGGGQIVHVSSFGVPTRQPRFAGYAASKAALDAALQCAAGEFLAKDVHVGTVYMPLVQTKMVESKGHSYDHVTMLTVDMACEYIEHAIITKRAEIIDSPSRFLAMMHLLRPHLINSLNSLVYRLESEKAPDAEGQPAQVRKKSSGKVKAKNSTKDMILRFLSSFMWFFSRVEFFLAIKCGMPWFIRDVLALLVLFVVLLLQPVIALVVKGVLVLMPAKPPKRAKSKSLEEEKKEKEVPFEAADAGDSSKGQETPGRMTKSKSTKSSDTDGKTPGSRRSKTYKKWSSDAKKNWSRAAKATVVPLAVRRRIAALRSTGSRSPSALAAADS